jgi:hypothetical protein
MTISITPIGAGGLELDIHGRMQTTDFDEFVPRAEEIIREHGSIGLLVHVGEIDDWTPHALWEDLHLDPRHYNDVFRLAIVGEDPGQDWIPVISRPFTTADVQFYRESELADARRWVEDVPIDVP